MSGSGHALPDLRLEQGLCLGARSVVTNLTNTFAKAAL